MAAVATNSSFSMHDIEQTLQIWGWAKWLMTDGKGINLRHANANWIFRIKRGGYRKSKTNPWAGIGDIEPEDALRLDAMIAKLPDIHKDILLGLYPYRMTIRDMAEEMRISKNSVERHRDYALCYLYGKLSKNS